VPKGWNGNWPAKFLTVPEKTNYVRTTSSYEIHEYIDLLKWNSKIEGFNKEKRRLQCENGS